MKNLTIFIFGFLILISCSPKPETTSAKISFGASFGPNEFPGGLYILGHNPDTKVVFTKRLLNTTTYEVDLDNGKWEFGAVGWDAGTSAMAGVPKCFITEGEIKLDGSPVDINLTPSTDGCGEEPFKSDEGEYNEASGSPRPAEFISCTKGDNEIFLGDDCSEAPGVYKSYKIVSYDVNFSNEERMFENRSNPFESTCITDGNNDHHVLRNPQVRPLIFKGIPQSIIAYSQEGCAGTGDKIDFKSGFYEGSQTVYGSFVKANIATNTNTFYIRQPLCPTYAVNNVGFEIGDGGTIPYVICNKAELEMMTGTNNYILGKNITATGFNTISSFTGNFNGNNKKIIGLDKPLINNFSNLSGEKFIGNFTIQGVNISTTGPYTGALINEVTAGTSTNTRFHNISIDSLAIGVNSTGANATGGLIGKISTSTGAIVNLSDIEVYSQGANIISFNGDSTSPTGGLIGKVTNPSGEVELNDIDIHNLTIISDQSETGGLIGYADNTNISGASLTKVDLNGTDQLGGIIGSAISSVIERSIFSEDDNGSISTISCSKAKGPAVTSPATDICDGIGGLIGTAQGSEIHHSLSNFSIIDFDDTFSNVGGAVGRTETSANLINNVGTIVYFDFNGSNVGGLIGVMNDGATHSFLGGVNITHSIAMGIIKIVSPIDLVNDNRGGLVGYNQNTSNVIRFSIANFKELTGGDNLGGITGKNLGLISECFANIENLNLDATSEGGDFAVGGITGYNGTSGRVEHSKVIANIEVIADNCDSASSTKQCGFVIGENINALQTFPARPVQFVSILGSLIETNVVNTAGYYSLGGSSGAIAPEIKTSSSNYSTISGVSGKSSILVDDITDLSYQTGLPNWVATSTILTDPVPLFLEHWIDYGLFNDPEFGGNRFRLGNLFEPFKIHNENEWNRINSDAFLLNKGFALADNIDFQNDPTKFVPIGAFVDPLSGLLSCNLSSSFTGTLLSNFNPEGLPFTLKNITINLDDAIWTANSCDSKSIGIITTLGNSSSSFISLAGTPDLPLLVDGLLLNNTTHDLDYLGSIAGISHSSFISARITNGEINTTSGAATNAGGLIGINSSITFIKNSLFSGKILGDARYIGGLVGLNTSSYFRVENSKVKIDDLITSKTSSYAGGLIGYEGTSDAIYKTNIIDFDLTKTTNFAAGSGGQNGGIAGSAPDSSIFENNLVIINGNNFGGSGSNSLFIGTSSTNIAIDSFIIGTSSDDSSFATAYFSNPQDFLDNVSSFDFSDTLYDNNRNEFLLNWEFQSHDSNTSAVGQ